MRNIQSQRLLIAIDGVLQHCNNSPQNLGHSLRMMDLSFVGLFVSYEHLLLVDWFDYVALGADGDVVVLSEVFSNQTYSRHFTDDLADVQGSSRHSLHNIVVVSLEVLDVLTWNTILDKIVMPFYAELRALAVLDRPLEVEHRRHFLFLTVILNDPFFLLLGHQPQRFLAEPALVIVENR
jgi:hypothetical protein